MSHQEIADEITDLNIAYMLLAQKLLRQDRAAGMLRLGITRELADFVLSLSPSQILKLASTNALLCGLRPAHGMPAVLATGEQAWLQQTHLFIVLAARHHESRLEPEEEVPA
ncbi:flagellar transcriptional regulator FlhD [Ramlibacter sp.]|uniref:flagellar transcriptional regulator FlhD n=1 Tax=Ramlibacter sp. TaxID=1917967 RepID=UPI002BF2CC7D|nr:flagellar transcriptional regulator FlhD [Ramlibacter sp.]HWI83365.1 flagellar transcriptional regulator FlhD [Ramlibacter sp.]